MKPRVLLDCDGVLADFIVHVCREVGDITGAEPPSPALVTEFDFVRCLALDQATKSALLDRIAHKPGWWEDIPVMRGRSLSAPAAVKVLHQIAEVYIVTSPWVSCPTWEHQRRRWLDNHFSIDSGRMISTSEKHLVSGDFFIDDKTESVVNWRKHQQGRAIRWNNPHNRLDDSRGVSADTGCWRTLIEWVRSPATFDALTTP